MEEPRARGQRRADALAKLAAANADAWVATASDQGPHLVPLSFAWTGTQLILAAEERSVTIRNIRSSGSARVALGTTRDVVMIDAGLDDIVPVEDAEATAAAYVGQADWDPRDAGPGYVFVLLRPLRVQAWREANEIAGRTVMRDGSWLD